MGELEVERHDVLVGLAAALLELVGRPVTASVQTADGTTLVLLCGRFERAFELPWQADEALVIDVGGGSVLIRADEVDDVDRWRFQVEGERFASACVYLRDGTSVLIHQDIEVGEPG
jgi:hypothetical protein